MTDTLTLTVQITSIVMIMSTVSMLTNVLTVLINAVPKQHVQILMVTTLANVISVSKAMGSSV